MKILRVLRVSSPTCTRRVHRVDTGHPISRSSPVRSVYEQLLVEEVRELRAAAVRAPGPTIPREPVLTCEQSGRRLVPGPEPLIGFLRRSARPECPSVVRD